MKQKIFGDDIEALMLDRNLAIEAVRVTEAAALASSKWTGRGDNQAADQAAVDAMRRALNSLSIDGTVVIGEGERDRAPMLYIGEKVGNGTGPEIDIALDPLEGTTICAKGAENSLSVIAMAERGGFLHAPDVYMEKIAVGGDLPQGVVDLDDPIEKNLQNLAKAKQCAVSELSVIILERERHQELIAKVREAGARIQLIEDGDIAAIMAAVSPTVQADMYVGTGGAPEGVLAAAALRCIGGQMQGRLKFSDTEQRDRAKRMGITDLNKIYQADEMAKGNVMLSVTGVTDGAMLAGVKRFPGGAITSSVVMRSRTGTVRYIQTHHNFNRKLETT